MSFDLYVDGLIPSDGEVYKKMKAIRTACEDVEIKEPREVTKFLDDERITCDGRSVDISRAISPSREEDGDVRIVDISKLPKGVTQIRIECSW